MFLNVSKFEKELKEAWKTQGFKILRTENRLVIDANMWVLEAELKNMPKEMMGAIIKYVGWLPEIGEALEFKEDEPSQVVLKDSVFRVGNVEADAEEETVRTPINLSIVEAGVFGVLQTTVEQCLFLVPEHYFKMFERPALLPEEIRPLPVREGAWLAYHNDYGDLLIRTFVPETGSVTEKMMRALEMTGEDMHCMNWHGGVMLEKL